MSIATTVDQRYPIGKYLARETHTPEEVASYIRRIASCPDGIEKAIKGLSASQLDTPYRDGGWTVRQVVHHVADSHMNAYIRVKWALTESSPVIKAYDEKSWAMTPETTGDPGQSLALLNALHVKWTALLTKLSATDFQRTFIHPSTNKQVRLDQMTAMYAWHGDHHTAHITSLRTRMNW